MSLFVALTLLAAAPPPGEDADSIIVTDLNDWTGRRRSTTIRAETREPPEERIS